MSMNENVNIIKITSKKAIIKNGSLIPLMKVAV